MTKKEKLIARFRSVPSDLTYNELIQILKYYGYCEFSLGKTTGSAVKFKNDSGDIIRFHKPHPENIIKSYVIEQILEKLEGED